MRLILAIFIILSLGNIARADHNISFYQQRINNPEVDNAMKTEYVDSLLAGSSLDRDSLLSLKINFAFEAGMNDAVIESYEKIGNNISKFDISTQCRLNLNYIKALGSKRHSAMSFEKCHSLLKMKKPDSLIYYDAIVYSLIYDLSRHTNLPLREDFVGKVELLLKSAREKGVAKSAVTKVERALHSMKMKRAIYEKDYDSSLAEADTLLSLPMTDNEKVSLESNMAFVYMLIGQYDAAEKIYQKILSSSNVGYNHGICLMNYTHMLNLQGRYGESLEMIDKYKSAARALNKDIYFSHLLANKAIAEGNTVGYERAFATMIENKELEDSLFFNSQVQDGLLLFDYSEKASKLSDLNSRYDAMRNLWWVFGGIMLILLTASAYAFTLAFKKNKLAKLLGEKLRESENMREENSMRLSQMEEANSGKAAAMLLQLAGIEEALDTISDISASKGKSPDDKIKKISDILSAVKREEDAREIFELQFEQAHSQFFKKLYASHPDLTQSEARVCAYLIMNLSSKEIASLTHKTIRSVEATRYRIGKKFNLPADKTLLSYLREFL